MSFRLSFLVLHVAASHFASSATTPLVASLDIDLDAPLFRTLPTYLSVNVDTGSLFNELDFSSPMLRALTRNLVRAAPTQLRVGGGAADSAAYTGEGGARGNCSLGAGVNVCIDAAYWRELAAFVGATGVELVWDLNLLFNRSDAASPWDSSNAESLIAAAAATPGVPHTWQLGNENELYYKHSPPLNMTGQRVASDYAALRRLLASAPPGVSRRIAGPDACCEERRTTLAEFSAAAAGQVPPLLSAVTFHEYPLPRNATGGCVAAFYTNLTAVRYFMSLAVAQYSAFAAPLLAEGVPLILGETATTALGGCDGLSNRFIAGFTFIAQLGASAEQKVAQVNRQDLVGWSSQTTPSRYALLGAPGWSRGPLAPHPDYFVALLWKQLVGAAVLRSTLRAADPAVAEGVAAHAWCAAAPGGGIVVAFANVLDAAVELELPPELDGRERSEFVLTAPGGDLLADAALLNGAPLAVGADGELPQWPLPGRRVPPPSAPPTLPPHSLGLLAVSGPVRACM